ncbi:MAG TPA: hypothetical protein VLH86_06495 [Patescibacteria group bacterium]|nr:hypothetical protein [Patescibacteria group bacterium]
MNIALPPEVGVRPYRGTLEDLQDTSTNISQYTALFRGDTGIGEVLGLAAELPLPNEPLQVVSAGCSYGVEVDTVLGLTHKYAPNMRVNIAGVDNNAAALTTAEAAQYRLYGSYTEVAGDYAATGHDFMSTMDEHGIAAIPYDIDAKAATIRTGKLRAEHEVSWRQRDLTRDKLTTAAAHLILCNNVMCYFRPQLELADAIAQNLGGHLAVGGIVSFGANLENGSMDGWARDVVPKLAEQGLAPLVTGNPKQVAFRRTV